MEDLPEKLVSIIGLDVRPSSLGRDRSKRFDILGGEFTGVSNVGGKRS